VTKGPLILWTPDLASIDWRVLVLAALSAILLLHRHWNIAAVLAASSTGALAMKFLLG